MRSRNACANEEKVGQKEGDSKNTQRESLIYNAFKADTIECDHSL